MLPKKQYLSIQVPKLDSFDLFSILLWVGILIPAVQLPSASTFTFLRSIFLVVWVAFFATYVAYRIYSEKKIFFYSATASNSIVAAIGGIFLLSYILSASKIDSLFGYDLSFSSSFLTLISLVVLFFVLKLAGLSLEFAVSRVLSVLPTSLVLLDVLSLFAFLLPSSVYERVLGGYAQYFTFLMNSPAALLGNDQQTFILHIVALVIAVWQFASIYKKGSALTVGIFRRGVVAVSLTIFSSYLFFVTFVFSTTTLIVYGITVAILATLIFSDKSSQVKIFGAVLGILVIFGVILGGLWWKAGIIGDSKTLSISASDSTVIIQQSFLNTTTPMWRQLTGFGVGTFPYLYMQYRPLTSAQMYGNDTYFFKPSSFVTELFVEHGAFGVLLFAALIISLIVAYKKATSKTSLIPELFVIVLISAVLLTSPSSLSILVIFFVALAAYFDKVEVLPELLPSVRAVDVTTYTIKSNSVIGQLLFILSIAYLAFIVITLVTPTMTMIGYSKAVQRYSVARLQVSKKDTGAIQTYSNAFATASNYRQYCKDCAQLSYLSLSTLLGTSELYAGLTEEQRNASQELRQVRNMILQSITDLLGKNSVRYDYWLSVSQAYRGIADDEKSSSFYTLAVQSVRNALSVNPYSIDANYLYINILLRLGNDAEINTEIKSKLSVLKKLVGTPYQIQFVDGVMLAREQNYDGSVKAFEAIKQDAADSKTLTTDEKKQIISLAERRIEEVKKLKETATPVKPIIQKPVVTPKVIMTPTTTATP